MKLKDLVSLTGYSEAKLNTNGIYLISSKDPSLFIGYVGASKNKLGFLARWRHHLNSLGKGIHHCNKLQLEINKIGIQKINFIILEEIDNKNSKEFFRQRENFWIEKLKSVEYEYNSHNNGLGKWKMTEAYRRNLSDSHIRTAKRGRNHPCSTIIFRYDLDGNFLDRWLCIEEVAKFLNTRADSIGKALIGKISHAKGFIWKYNFEGLKIKHEIKLRKVGLPILQIDSEGFIVNRYASIKDASRKLGIERSLIQSALKHEHKSKGYYWKYEK